MFVVTAICLLPGVLWPYSEHDLVRMVLLQQLSWHPLDSWNRVKRIGMVLVAAQVKVMWSALRTSCSQLAKLSSFHFSGNESDWWFSHLAHHNCLLNLQALVKLHVKFHGYSKWIYIHINHWLHFLSREGGRCDTFRMCIKKYVQITKD